MKGLACSSDPAHGRSYCAVDAICVHRSCPSSPWPPRRRSQLQLRCVCDDAAGPLSEGKNTGAAFAAAQPAEAQFFVAAAARGAAALLELLRLRVALRLWPHSCVQVVLWLRVLEHLWRDAKAAFWLRVADASRLASELRCSKSSAAFVSRSRPLARKRRRRKVHVMQCHYRSTLKGALLVP